MAAVALCTTHSAEELDRPHVLARVPDDTGLVESGFFRSAAPAR